jgi:hypothetical protein
MNNISELKKQINEARDKARETFGSTFAEIFEKYPQIETLGWPQYTPYFNDGDVCEFRSCHDWNQYVNGYCISYDEADELTEQTGLLEADYNFIAEKVCDVVGQFDDDDLKYMFGEGMITFNRDGSVEVDDYDHD